MRLLIVTSSYPSPFYEAAGSFVREMARLLAERGHEVFVLTPHTPGAALSETRDGVNIRRFRYAWPANSQTLAGGRGGIMPRLRKSWRARAQVPGLIIGCYLGLRKLLAETDYDRILAHWIIPSGIVTRAVCVSKNIPFSVFTPGSEFTAFGGRLVPLLRPVVADAHEIYAASEYVIDLIDSSCSPRFIDFFPMAVNLSDFPYESFRSFADPLKILVVGRLVDWKGTAFAIEAMKILHDRKIGARLTIVGDGPTAPRLRQLTQSLGLNDAVSFLADITHRALVDLYHQADIFLQPSIEIPGQETEGLGVTLLEAQASGSNVIASRVGGIPTAVVDGETGLLVPPQDANAIAEAVMILYRDPILRQKFREAGRARIEERFDWNTLIARLETQIMKRERIR